jgi:hypothetical protein
MSSHASVNVMLARRIGLTSSIPTKLLTRSAFDSVYLDQSRVMMLRERNTA